MFDGKPFRLIGMSGSLRAGSYSNAVLDTLREKFAGRAELEVYDLAPIPAYNQDFEGDKRPPIVKKLLVDIADADGLVLCAPEFNHSIPGVLKNAIDVASRPYGKSSFLGKPIGIVSTSPGPLGGVSAAKHLQNILPGIAGPILGQPEIYLNGVSDAFDDKGALAKEALQKVLQQYIDAFAAFIETQNR